MMHSDKQFHQPPAIYKYALTAIKAEYQKALAQFCITRNKVHIILNVSENVTCMQSRKNLLLMIAGS